LRTVACARRRAAFWLVSFIQYNLGYFDLEQKTLHPWTYSSHSVWQSKATFEAWTKSGGHSVLPIGTPARTSYLDHQQFEGFEVRQTVRRGEDAVA
jgi:heme-degrading monooxygenase HmoA